MKRITQEEIYKCAVEHGWWESYPDYASRVANIPEKLCLIHSEISEALEEYRENTPLEGYEGEKGKPEGLIIELADAVIRAYDLCGALGLDLDEAIAKKHEYNLRRPYRHGGKVC